MPPQTPNRYSEIYKPMREKAAELKNQFHDFAGGDFKDPHARVINTEMQNLIDDIDGRRVPTSLDYRIKSIQNNLRQAKRLPKPFMKSEHYDYMHHNYENMRMGLHKLE